MTDVWNYIIVPHGLYPWTKYAIDFSLGNGFSLILSAEKTCYDTGFSSTVGIYICNRLQGTSGHELY